MKINENNAVPWYNKKWPLSDDLQNKIRAHVDTLEGEKRDDYIKFITGHCGYKMAF